MVQAHREEAASGLEELLAASMSEDRENCPVLRLTLIDLWQEEPGTWAEQTPAWLRTLGTIATTAHVKYDPFVRRPTPS